MTEPTGLTKYLNHSLSYGMVDKLPPLANLEAYISAVQRVPMLTPEEEKEYSERYRKQGDLQAAGKLVLSHLKLVVSTARQYLGYGLPYADLIQEGSIGLMKAVKRFDPEKGARLGTFALHAIKAEIHEYILKNWRLVRISTTKAHRKLFFNLRSLKGSNETLDLQLAEKIAKKLSVKPSDVFEMDVRMSGQDLALEADNHEEDHFAPIAYLEAVGSQPEEIIEQKNKARLQTQGLSAALETLDPRSRAIVESRWLAEEGQEKTLHELADEYGVSAERVRQIESAAMKKMRLTLNAQPSTSK
jgi:RNA polymerase sigma-32 factor